MNISDDRLKRAYRSYVDGLCRGTRKDCPPPADLARFFSAGASRPFKAGILDHVAGCGSCAREFEIFLAMDRSTRDFAEKSTILLQAGKKDQKPRSSRGFIVLGRWLFAGVGFAAASGLFLFLARKPADGPAAAAEVFRSGRAPGLSLNYPRGTVEGRSALVFSWRPVERSAGETYVVNLFDDALRRIWISPVIKETSLVLPEEIGRSLEFRRRYYWMVERSSLSPASESDLVPFTLVRRRPDF